MRGALSMAGAAVAMLSPAAANAQVSAPTCPLGTQPALSLGSEPTVVGREGSFDVIGATEDYDTRSPAFVFLTSTKPGFAPFTRTLRGDISERSFYFTPTRRQIGGFFRASLRWTQRGEGQPPCSATASAQSRVIAGKRPRIRIRSNNDGLYLYVTAAKGGCERAQVGTVGLIVRGPDRTRTVRLSDACGRWTKPTGGHGWRLRGYSDGFEGSTAFAAFAPTFRTAGRRIFRVQVTFAGNTVERDVLTIRTRVCTSAGCMG